jgi:hypothetical protein
MFYKFCSLYMFYSAIHLPCTHYEFSSHISYKAQMHSLLLSVVQDFSECALYINPIICYYFIFYPYFSISNSFYFGIKIKCMEWKYNVYGNGDAFMPPSYCPLSDQFASCPEKGKTLGKAVLHSWAWPSKTGIWRLPYDLIPQSWATRPFLKGDIGYVPPFCFWETWESPVPGPAIWGGEGSS